MAGCQGAGVLRTLNSLVDGQKEGELVARAHGIPRLPGPGGEVGAGRQGVRMLGTLDTLTNGQQGGVLVTRPGGIPRLPRPLGEILRGRLVWVFCPVCPSRCLARFGWFLRLCAW